MLQNRVDPCGNLIKTESRGFWMGNRGILHNDKEEVIRPFKLRAWLTCKLEFNGRKRQVMAPDRYTELFFLDEATAFAAGHRPCFECRRNDFNRFKSFWLEGNPNYGFNARTPIQHIDAILHHQRISGDKSKVTFQDRLNNLPDGTFILLKNQPFLILDTLAYLWSPSGYDTGIALYSHNELTVLTPRSVVNMFKAGYEPQVALRN
jgi:hypothetical protein